MKILMQPVIRPFQGKETVIKMSLLEKTEKTLKLKREQGIIISIYFGALSLASFPFAFLQQYAFPKLITAFYSNTNSDSITLKSLFSLIIPVSYLLIGIGIIYIILTFQIVISCIFDKNYNQIALEKFSVLGQARIEKKPLTSLYAVEITSRPTLDSSPDRTYQISLRFNSNEKLQLTHSLSRTEVSELAGEIKDFLNCKVYGLPK